jgi:predicted Zn-dependent peptidase
MEQGNVFLEHQLGSGVQVVGQPMRGVESAALGILVGAGARDEETGQFGVSHFVEQMLFRGTEHLDARALSDRMDDFGISYDSSSGVEMTLISAMLLGEHTQQAADLLLDVARFPSFPEDDLDNVRALLVQERRQREDRPAQRVMELLRQRFYAGSPLAHDILGTEETVASLGRDDLARYWRDRYTPNNVIISVAGRFEWDPLIARLEELTADWTPGSGRMAMDQPVPNTTVEVLHRQAAQENVGFAFPGVPVTHDDYYALALGIQALGGSSNSRLFQEVREKRGLAYAVQARFDGLEKSGMVRVYAGTTADRAHESVEVIIHELQRLADEGITADELELSKTRLKSQMIMRSESTSARMLSNIRNWWFEGRLRTLQEVKERIDQVTLEQVRDIVGTVGIMSNLTAVALGPRTEEELFGGLLAHS